MSVGIGIKVVMGELSPKNRTLHNLKNSYVNPLKDKYTSTY